MTEAIRDKTHESNRLGHRSLRAGAAAALLVPLVVVAGCDSQPSTCLSPRLVSKIYAGNPAKDTAIYLPDRPANSLPQPGQPNSHYQGIELGYTDPGDNWHNSDIESPGKDQDNYLVIGENNVRFSIQTVWEIGDAACSSLPTGITFGNPVPITSLPPAAHGQQWQN